MSVEGLLSCDDVGSICAAYNDVGHDGDNDVLLDIERSWIERPYITKSAETSCWEDRCQTFTQRKRRQLSSYTSDDDGGIYEEGSSVKR